MKLRSGTDVAVSPLGELHRLKTGPHLLAHYAFVTREHVSQLGLTSYIACNEEITKLVAAHVNLSRPVGVTVVSSGAVYLGDDLDTNPYGVLKARDERLFVDIAARLGARGSVPRVVVPRLFNLSGPFLNKPDYVLGSIIKDIARGGPIQLHADHPVVRSYVHVRDLVDLVFAMMLADAPVPLRTFDTAGECEIEVGRLAELAAAVLGQPAMPIQRPPVDEARPDRYVGDASTMRSLADSCGIELMTLARQIEDTATYIGT
jgi:UDP-glucuronate decarboxylase